VTVLAPNTAPASPRLEGARSHSILNIPTVSVGAVLRPLTADDDLLSEMLEGRACSMASTPAFLSRWTGIQSLLTTNQADFLVFGVFTCIAPEVRTTNP
jgi:hypothetical protein